MAVQEIRRYTDEFQVWQATYENVSFLAHWHREAEWIRVCKGTVHLIVENKTYLAKEGDLLVCDSGCVHSGESPGDANCVQFLLFDPLLIQMPQPSITAQGPLITAEQLEAGGLTREVERVFETVGQELTTRGAHYQPIVRAVVQAFWYRLCRLCGQDTEREISPKAEGFPLGKVTEYMEQNLGEELSLSQVAEHVTVSKYHLSRCFKQYTGMNFVKYRNLMRLERAVTLLQNTDQSVSAIAFSCGFQDIRTCNRVFRQYTEHVPLDFRRDPHLNLHRVVYPHVRREDDLVVHNDSPVVRHGDR